MRQIRFAEFPSLDLPPTHCYHLLTMYSFDWELARKIFQAYKPHSAHARVFGRPEVAIVKDGKTVEGAESLLPESADRLYELRIGDDVWNCYKEF